MKRNPLLVSTICTTNTLASLPPLTGIGFHVDNYDVFLIQILGTRNWTIEVEPLSEDEEFTRLDDKHDVRILKASSTKRTVTKTLKPGDMLYLPPRIPHCGTATSDDCMTLR